MLPPYRGILSALLFWSCYFSLCLSCLIRADLFRSGSNHSSSFRFGSFGAAFSVRLLPLGLFQFNLPISSCLAVSLVLFSLQSQSLSLSASLAFPVRFSQFSPSLSVTPFMYFSSVYATRPPSSIFSVQSKLRGSLCSIFSSVPASLLFSSILPVCLCLSVPLPVLFVPSRPHPRSGLVSVQNCR